MTTESAFSRKEVFGLIFLAFVAMAVTTVAVVPSLKTKVKEIFTHEERRILAKVTGNMGPRGPKVTALKIQSREGLSVEIYTDSDDGLKLSARIPLAETQDGYFTLQGNATNLALADVDYDGLMELVAPSYDNQMVPRLNIFKYNEETKTFDRVNAPEGFEPY